MKNSQLNTSPGCFKHSEATHSGFKSPDINDTIVCSTIPEIDLSQELSIYSSYPTNISSSTYSTPIPTSSTSLKQSESDIYNVQSFAVTDNTRPNYIPRKDILSNTVNTSHWNSPYLQVNFTSLDTNTSARDENTTNVNADEGRDKADDGTVSPSTIKSSSSQNRTHAGSPYDKYLRTPTIKNKQLCRTVQTKQSVEENDVVSASKIYVIHPQGIMYQLEFTAAEVMLTPLYVHPRLGAMLTNDKKVQPENYPCSESGPVSEHSSLYVLRQKFCLISDDQPKQTKTLPPLRVYTDEPRAVRKRSLSDGTRAESTIGQVNIPYENMLIRVICEPLHMSRMKLPVPEDIQEKMKKLGMSTSDSRKNKGTIVAKCGNDLLQFTFKMKDITFKRIDLKDSVAVQTEDKMVYIREKSEITGRTCLIAIPETTYFYRDPMSIIHRLHTNFQGTNTMPLWKYRLMKARIEERRGITTTSDKIEKAFKHTRGSQLCFDGLDSIISVQAGMLCCVVPKGLDDYETMMREEYELQQSSPYRRYYSHQSRQDETQTPSKQKLKEKPSGTADRSEEQDDTGENEQPA